MTNPGIAPRSWLLGLEVGAGDASVSPSGDFRTSAVIPGRPTSGEALKPNRHPSDLGQEPDTPQERFLYIFAHAVLKYFARIGGLQQLS